MQSRLKTFDSSSGESVTLVKSMQRMNNLEDIFNYFSIIIFIPFFYFERIDKEMGTAGC